MKEGFYIAKHLHIPYEDTLNMTPLERGYLIEFIVEDFKRKADARQAFEASREANRRN